MYNDDIIAKVVRTVSILVACVNMIDTETGLMMNNIVPGSEAYNCGINPAQLWH